MKKRSEKQLTSKELLKKAENAYKRASVKEKISTVLVWIGVIALALCPTSGIAAAGVGLARNSLLDKYAQTSQYELRLEQDTQEALLSSDNLADAVKYFDSYEYKEKCLRESGQDDLIKKHDRLKKAEKGLLITLAASGGIMLASVPAIKLTESSQEKDEVRARDYAQKAQFATLQERKKDENDEENDDPIEN